MDEELRCAITLRSSHMYLNGRNVSKIDIGCMKTYTCILFVTVKFRIGHLAHFGYPRFVRLHVA